ncbi:MAG: hypothetical protein ABFC63_01880 [Thermoguttaceae bacterium]
MKRLLTIAVLGTLLCGVAGCRFWNCLWRGPQNQGCTQTVAPCPSACPTYSPCDPCAGATTATTPVVTPGTPTYAPGPAS